MWNRVDINFGYFMIFNSAGTKLFNLYVSSIVRIFGEDCSIQTLDIPDFGTSINSIKLMVIYSIYIASQIKECSSDTRRLDNYINYFCDSASPKSCFQNYTIITFCTVFTALNFMDVLNYQKSCFFF